MVMDIQGTIQKSCDDYDALSKWIFRQTILGKVESDKEKK